MCLCPPQGKDDNDYGEYDGLNEACADGGEASREANEARDCGVPVHQVRVAGTRTTT